MARLEIRLFGDVEVRLDGQLLKFPTQKTKELFAYLVTHRQCAHPRAALAGLLWAESDEEKAKVNLRKTLSRLRQAFGVERDADAWLDSSGGALRFKTEDCWIDLAEFESLLAEDPKQINTLERALALYRGPFLPGVYEDWALLAGERLQTLYLEALEQLADAYQARREYEQASAVWKKTLQTVPWHERAHRELITLCALAGDRAAALQQYTEYVGVLQRELNATPLPETSALYEQLLQGAPLKPPAQPAAPPREMPFVGRQREREILKTLWESVLGGAGQAVFIGGEVGVGKTTFVQNFIEYITTPPRHGEESSPFPFREGGQGVRSLQGAAYAFGGELPYQPLLQAVRAGVRSVATETLAELPAPWRSEFSQFIPELHGRSPEIPPNPELAPAQGKARWFAALTGFFELLARERPRVLFLDDLHWADSATLEYLGHLTAELSGLPILLIGTYRSEEALEGSRLRTWLDALGPGRAYQPVTLSRLSREETELLVEQVLGVGTRRAVPLLYEKTEGNPLFLGKLVRAFVQSGLLQPDDHGDWRLTTSEISAAHLPESLRELIHAALRRAPEGERHLLGLAAVMGGAFELSVVREILRQPEEKLIDRFDGLRRAGLLVERAGRYQFYHELIRQVVYDELSADRRRLWHRQVGQTLEELYPERLDELSGELAEHFERAQLWEKAIQYAMRAGQRAQKIYAYGEAKNFFKRALRSFEHLETKSSLGERLKYLKLELLNCYTGRGIFPTVADIKPALAELHTAVTEMLGLATELGDEIQLCEAYKHLARVEIAQGHWNAGREARLRALELNYQWINKQSPKAEVATRLETTSELNKQLGQHKAALEDLRRAAQIWATLGHIDHHGRVLGHMAIIELSFGKLAEARQHAEQALEYLQGGDPHRLASVLNNLGLILREMQQWQDVQTHYERALTLMKESKDPRGIGIVLINLGAFQADQGHYEKALRYFEQALELLKQEGTKGLETELFSEIGRAHLGLGELTLALAYSTRAIRLLEEHQAFVTNEYLFYFRHSQILQANQHTDEARAYLQKAYEELRRVAGAIREAALRESFLQNVPINRQIIAAWEAVRPPSKDFYKASFFTVG